MDMKTGVRVAACVDLTPYSATATSIWKACAGDGPAATRESAVPKRIQ